MVRRKEPAGAASENSASRNVKVTVNKPVRPSVSPAPKDSAPEVRMQDGSKPVRFKSGAGKKTIWALILVLVLLGVGWFAAKAALGGNGGGFLTNLFSSGSKLIGEEDGRVNFLLMGTPGDPGHEGPNLTDSLMVASYNVADKKLNLFSLPRDLQVTLEGYGSSRINAVYEMTNDEPGQGEEVLAATVSEVLGIKVPYYFRIDFSGFTQLVDELGGVQVEVSKDLYDPFYPDANKGYELLDIKAGNYTMSGEMALKYARSRKTTSDFDRARRQQEILLSLRQKALDLDLLTTPAKLLAVSELLEDHFGTNLSAGELERTFKLFADLDSTTVVTKVFDDTQAGLLYADKVEGAFVLKPVGDNYTKIHEFVAASLTETEPTTTEPTTAEPLKIEVFNGTNTTGLAGKMADQLKKAGFTIVRVGNNPTRGLPESVIYVPADSKLLSGIRQLAEIAGATVSSETMTLPAGVDARLVLGANTQVPEGQ